MERKHEKTKIADDVAFKLALEAGKQWYEEAKHAKWHESEVADAIVDMAMKDHPYPKKKSTKYYLVTINFKDHVVFEEIIKKFNKWRSKKWIKESYSCIELRNKNGGIHIHSEVIANRSKSKFEIIRETYSTFKRLVGSKYSIDVRINLHGFKRYVDGYRQGKVKDCMPYTIAFRKERKLSNILELPNK